MTDDNPVWADVWNPEANEWNPSADPYPAEGTETIVDYQSHGDIAAATPLSESYGQPPAGTVPDVRKNLLTDVKERSAQPPPPQIVQHLVDTVERGTPLVRTRMIVVKGNTFPVTLLEENELRTRAIIKVVTAAASIMVQQLRSSSGGVVGLTAVPSSGCAAWPQSNGDNDLKVETTAGLECYGIGPGPPDIVVAVWEELTIRP